jgi:hypothetical protein
LAYDSLTTDEWDSNQPIAVEFIVNMQTRQYAVSADGKPIRSMRPIRSSAAASTTMLNALHLFGSAIVCDVNIAPFVATPVPVSVVASFAIYTDRYVFL